MKRSIGWKALSSGLLVILVLSGSVGSIVFPAGGIVVLEQASQVRYRVARLTDNQYGGSSPQIHNGQVTWQGSDGNDDEIFLYDGSSVLQLTNNQYHDADPQIHNGRVTWYGYDGNDLEIYTATRKRAVIYIEPENNTITSDDLNAMKILVVTPEESIFLDPGESFSPPDAAPQTFTLNLTAGWNMISLPFLPMDPSTQSVMSDADHFQLVTWSGTGYVNASEFELGKGYWLLVLEDTEITITQDQ